MNRGEVIRLWIFLACLFSDSCRLRLLELEQSIGFSACRGRHGPSNGRRPQYDQLRHPVKFRYWLIAIVVLAAALRFVPIWFGLPFAQARPDETAALGLAVSVRSRDLNPHFFHWPSLTLYIFAAVHTVLSWVRAAAGGTSALSFADLMISARAVVATAGTLTVVVVFVMARRMGGQVFGLLSAFFLAVSILHVRDSHFAMTDVLMTSLSTTSLMLLLRALDATDRDRIKPIAWFAISGLVAGLATSTKYNAGALVAAMAGAQIWLLTHRRHSPWRMQSWLPSLAFGLCLVLGFVAGTPYSILDYRAFTDGPAVRPHASFRWPRCRSRPRLDLSPDDYPSVRTWHPGLPRGHRRRGADGAAIAT